MPKKLTTQEFIDRASFYHGNKYDYSKSVYISASKKIEIICPKHGPFIQNAGSHINPSIKAGCPYCARKKVFPGESDLLSQNPQIATLFDEEKNGIKANEIFAKTNKKYWWHCDFGYDHIYEMSPNAKITKKFKCPYCSGQKVLIGFNDLKTKFPDIASEWDYKKIKRLHLITHMEVATLRGGFAQNVVCPIKVTLIFIFAVTNVLIAQIKKFYQGKTI